MNFEYLASRCFRELNPISSNNSFNTYFYKDMILVHIGPLYITFSDILAKMS